MHRGLRAFMLAAACALSTASTATAATPATDDTPLFIDHYVQGPDGTTITTTTDLEGNPLSQLLAADTVPFQWTADWDSVLRTRDMKSPTGRFCIRYRSDYQQNQSATPHTDIVLIKNRSSLPDDRLETRTVNNNDGIHDRFWPEHDAGATYHFNFELPNHGFRVKAHGSVRATAP